MSITANGVSFVACDMGAVYRSVDDGVSWAMLNTRDVISGDDGAFSVASKYCPGTSGVVSAAAAA